MSYKLKLVFPLLFVTLLLMPQAKSHAENVKLIPREVLFGNPEKAGVNISPRGKYLSYLAPVNGVLNVWIRTLGKSDDQVVTSDTERGIRQYFWSYAGDEILYLQDVGGNENWRLYGVDLKTRKTRDLTPFENVQVRVIGSDKKFPNELLIGMNKDNPALHDIYHLDLKTGALERIVKNPGNISDWIVDDELHVRAALAQRALGGSDLLYREKPEDPWKTVLTWDSDDAMASGPMTFSKNPQVMYLRDSSHSDTSQLVTFDVITKERQVLAHNPKHDIARAMIHPDSKQLLFVSFSKDHDEYHYMDKGYEQDAQIFKKAHAGELVWLHADVDLQKWLGVFITDQGSAAYYLFDRETKKITYLFDDQPELNDYPLVPMESFKFTSRDGLEIRGYLSFPKTEAKQNLPMVLVVHGGPWVRDGWGMDPKAQWLANRGYLVMQVNYRGSVGYGKAFVNAANKEWGGKMHDDLVDAVNWAVEKGYADPERLAIYGGSYGGYAALVGATFTPDLFKCAVDLVGPSNLITFIRSTPAYWSVYLAELHRRVGNPDTEPDFLKSRSPLFKVDQIKIPMLIAQGANDPRVNQAESEQIVAAMKERGIDHEYMLFPDEGHGFAKPENRLKFYSAAERFLAKHLGGRYEE